MSLHHVHYSLDTTPANTHVLLISLDTSSILRTLSWCLVLHVVLKKKQSFLAECQVLTRPTIPCFGPPTQLHRSEKETITMALASRRCPSDILIVISSILASSSVWSRGKDVVMYVFRNCFAISDDEATTTGNDPNLSCMIGPYFWAKL